MPQLKASTPNWSTLVRTLLLGIDQTAVSASVEEDAAEQLLEKIGKVHLLRKATGALYRWEGAIPQAPSEEGLVDCSIRSVQHLQAILGGQYEPALPEFARLLLQHRRRLPPMSWPVLLEQSRQSPELWPSVAPLLDARARWLLQQHPEWQRLQPADEALTSWHAAPKMEQVDWLRAYRQQDANAARASLQTQWEQLGAAAQARLLPALSINITPEDEELLEHALQIGRKPLKMAAAELLSQLPQSSYVQRLCSILETHFLTGNDELEADPPAELTKELRNAGIYLGKAKVGTGMQESLLMEILGRIPISYWAARWQTDTATALMRLLQHQRFHRSIQKALVNSLLRVPDTQATEAIVNHWLLLDQDTNWNSKAAKSLLQRTSASFFNEAMLRWLENYGPMVPENSLPAYWLLTAPHAWQAPLTKFVVLGFRDVIQGRRADQWGLYHYKSLLARAAYQSDPALFDSLRHGWSQAGALGRWHADLEQMLQVLHFRRAMQAEIATSSRS